jgi:hypothetical protein
MPVKGKMGSIAVELPGNKEKVYFEKRTGKVLNMKGKELPNQKRWLTKIQKYASQKADDYGQNVQDHLYDRVRKALARSSSTQKAQSTKRSSTKTKKSFLFW